jgi:undecaprenyl diphosphate synthase
MSTVSAALPRRSGAHTALQRLHVAIIMDGNGRWANARLLPRSAGHHAGVRTARAIVEAAVRAGIETLTLYAFSADNWGRPQPEVLALMRLFRRSLLVESKRCLENGVRLTIVGRRDRLPAALRQTINQAEAMTANGRNLHLRVAVDYSSRDAILRAAAKAREVEGALTREKFGQLLADVDHDPGRVKDVDLLIRTGGEQRLSDFLLWECAYAELVFSQTMWPDFSEADLRAAITEFETRERRFGRVPNQAAS